MRKELHRGLGKLAAHQVDAGPLCIRVVQVLRPDLPYDEQDRWLATAEACVLDLLERQGARTVMVWSRTVAPGIVAVDAGRRFRVDATGADPVFREEEPRWSGRKRMGASSG